MWILFDIAHVVTQLQLVASCEWPHISNKLPVQTGNTQRQRKDGLLVPKYLAESLKADPGKNVHFEAMLEPVGQKAIFSALL
jgi:hypothetical protein